MPPREDDDVAPRDVVPRAAAPRVAAPRVAARRVAVPRARTLVLAAGFALAVLATLAVFLTDNPQYLRVAVVAVAWAFVLAMFAAGRRDTDRVAAAAREAELRQIYEAELDREVAARREYELELEHELRREAENSMRYELDALRGDIAALSGLRDEVARVSALRGDIVALSGLRDDVARVAALRDDVAALMALRQDLGQLADLRADMGRLRAELTEQLSSEMLVERIIMRTQASRMPGEPVRMDAGPGRALEGSGWADDVPPRELTGGWPAIRLDEPRETTQFEEVRIGRSGPRPPVPDPVTTRHAGREAAPAGPPPWDAPLPTYDAPGTGAWPTAPETSTWPSPVAGTSEDRRSRYPADEPAGPPPTAMTPIAPASIARPPAPVPPPTTMTPIAPASIARPPVPVSTPEPAPAPATAFHEVQRPLIARPPVPPPVTAAPPSPLDWLAARSLLDPPAPASSQPDPRTTHRPAVPPPPARDKRLADILAENGVSPSAGGRRRRRYREEGEPDDVLARILGQG